MSFFDQAYDEMSWQEICYRLPGELAINALKRRITNLETLGQFFACVQSQPASMKDLRSHVNKVLLDFTVDEIFDKFDQSVHPTLFNWVDESNRKRLKNDGQDKLGHKFLYNLANGDDADVLNKVLDHVLTQPSLVASEVLSVLNKVNSTHFVPMLNKILSDSRPEVRALILCIGQYGNAKLISRHQKVIALKAMAKAGHFDRVISALDFSIFGELKALERLDALEMYLSKYPLYRKSKPFSPMPTEDEMNLVLFAGCIEHNERVQKLSQLYKDITETELSKEET